MIVETAVVTGIEPGAIRVRRRQAGACGGCAQQPSCATAALGGWLPERELVVPCDKPHRIGDTVVIGLDDSPVLRGTLLLYLLPLLIMFASVLVADRWLDEATADTWMPAIALSTVIAAFRLIHCLQPLLPFTRVCQPHVLPDR